MDEFLSALAVREVLSGVPVFYWPKFLGVIVEEGVPDVEVEGRRDNFNKPCYEKEGSSAIRGRV